MHKAVEEQLTKHGMGDEPDQQRKWLSAAQTVLDSILASGVYPANEYHIEIVSGILEDLLDVEEEMEME